MAQSWYVSFTTPRGQKCSKGLHHSCLLCYLVHILSFILNSGYRCILWTVTHLLNFTELYPHPLPHELLCLPQHLTWCPFFILPHLTPALVIFRFHSPLCRLHITALSFLPRLSSEEIETSKLLFCKSKWWQAAIYCHLNRLILPSLFTGYSIFITHDWQ
jgi:hypothetical protein